MVPPVPPPTRPALRERYDQRRQRVVAAAAKVFAQQGFAATSISDLSQATGLAAGGLYHYIGTKDALLFTICDELLDPLLERSRAIVADETLSTVDQFRLFMRAWVTQVGSHRDHMIVFAQERKVLEKGAQWRRIRTQGAEFEDLLEAIFLRGEHDGTMRFDDRQLMLLTLLGMVNYTPQWLNPRGRLSPEQIADSYCDLVLLAARSPQSSR